MEIYHEEGLIGEFQKLVKQIPLKQQEVLVSMKFEGLSVKETASKLKMSEYAVKVTAHRAFQTLKKKCSNKTFSNRHFVRTSRCFVGCFGDRVFLL